MKRNNDIKHYSSKEEKCRTKALRRPDADLSLDPTKRTHTSTSTPEVHNQNQMLEFPASSLIHPQASNQQISNIVQHEIEPELLTLLQEYEEGCAPDKFRTASTSATTAAAKYKAEETEWKQRQRAQDEAFGSVRESDRNKVIAQTLELFSGICSHCRKLEGRVLCHTCHTLLCPKCDSAFHFSHISHGRIILQEGVLHKLQSTQHIDLLGRVQNRDVPVPIFPPRSCPRCLKVASWRIQCGTDKLSIVTMKGREDDISSPNFECVSCNFIKIPSAADYMTSDYWPGTLPNINSLVHGSVLREWQLLMFHAPGTSQGKYITVLDEIASLSGRDTKVNRTHFNRASHEYKFFHYKVEKDTLHRHGRCKACGSSPLGYHCDGNRKLYRLQSAKDRDGQSLYGNDIIEDDEEQLTHTLKLEAKLGKPSGETCGASSFQAIRSAENSKAKNLDITGIVMMTCTHGSTVRITKMKKGESFSLTHLMHIKAEKMNVKFFCSDVVCKYSKWAVKVGKQFPEYKALTENVQWFLSRFHGLVHGWGCRVLFNGHWNEGAADFIGEEGEQAFSIYSRFANSLKHTSSFMYNDNLSSLTFSRNVDVENGMVNALCKWLDVARKNSVLFERELQKLLKNKGLTVKELPEILEQLKQQASTMEGDPGVKPDRKEEEVRRSLGATSVSLTLGPLTMVHLLPVNGRNLSKNWTVGELERELEGESFMMRVLKARISKFSDSSKARSVEHHKMSQKKARIDKIIERLKEKGVVVTQQHLDDGIFPWHTVGSVPLIEYYAVIDAWMLSLRYKEAIVQNQNEMVMFIKEWQNIKNILLSDIEHYEIMEMLDTQTALLNRSKIVLAKTEVKRIEKILKLAISRFSNTLSYEELEVAPFSQGDEFTDEQTEMEEELLEGLGSGEGFEEQDLDSEIEEYRTSDSPKSFYDLLMDSLDD